MNKELMIDLETLGQKNSPAVISASAVHFDRNGTIKDLKINGIMKDLFLLFRIIVLIIHL